MKRRQWMQNLALGAAGLSLTSFRRFEAAGQVGSIPKRIVFFTTQHGPPRNTWKMAPPGLPSHGSADITSLNPGEFSRVLEPLHRVRESVSILDGLSMMSCMIDRFGNNNNHGVAWSNLLVNLPFNADNPFQGTRDNNLHPRPGGASIDQYIAQRTAGGTRLDSVVWGTSGRFGSSLAYSSNELGQWIVPNNDPSDAYRRLMGTGRLVPGEDPGDPPPPLTRADRVRAARFRAYNHALTHFDRIAPQLGSEDQASLVAHRNQLERLGMRFDIEGETGPGGTTQATCMPTFSPTGNSTEDFFRLTAIGLACDAVRVVALDARELRGSQIGGSDSDDVHQAFAHGTDAFATQMMENYYNFHANEFATLVEYLRDVPEGDGTLLDNTLVIWVPELATGSHMFDDAMTIIAGGGATGFSPGRYIRFAQNIPNVGCNYGCENTMVGPGRMHLFVNAMRHMGMSDNHFGRATATAADGSPLDLSGPLDLVS